MIPFRRQKHVYSNIYLIGQKNFGFHYKKHVYFAFIVLVKKAVVAVVANALPHF